MVFKKKCSKCNKKIDKGFSYCPHCGFSNVDREKEEKDYGFLGRQDVGNADPFAGQIKLPFGFNTIFKKLMKEMDKQFQELDREIGKEREDPRRINVKRNDLPQVKHGGISINISGGGDRPVVKVKSFGNVPGFRVMEREIQGNERIEKPIKKIKNPEISEEKARKLAKLPREEAESKVRRLSGRVIYEIELPEVKEEKDIIVQQLENSIEIKAFAKDKAYFKFLPVSLPLIDYKFDKGKLILELGEDN